MTQRSPQQNRALHLAAQLLADALNNAGLDQRKVLKPSIDIPWTKESVKYQLIHPIMTAMYGHKSTTELEKIGEIENIWDVLMRHLGEKFGLEYIPFPHEEKTNVRLSQHAQLSDESYPEMSEETQADKF